MNLPEMRSRVRRDLKDEDSVRWTDSELNRAIDRALREFSQRCPREMKTTLPTTEGSRTLDISSLTDRVSIDYLEYPIDKYPRVFRKFYIYLNTLTIGSPFDPSLKDSVPDGSNCHIYWGKLHTLDGTTSTIPPQHQDLIALGAAAYAIISQSQYSTERVSVGGRETDRDYSFWGGDRLRQFQRELKQISRTRKLRIGRLYGD